MMDIISVKLDLNVDDPRLIIDDKLNIYRKFSQVSELKNNGTRLDKQDGRTIALNEYLIREHGADAGNIRHADDKLTLLRDTISLSVDKASSIVLST